jgi:molecular chaperone GrpE
MTNQKPTEPGAAVVPPEQAETGAADTKPRPAVGPEAAMPHAAEEPLAQLRAELEAAQDHALRCHAELENYRKRATREAEERLRYANLGLLRDLLPALDNVERAIAAAGENADVNALLEGFRMVHRQLEDVLRRHHCRRIEAHHMPFDPNLHHAVMQQPSDEYPENTVLMVTQQGYQLHDRVVRPSQVIVSKTSG